MDAEFASFVGGGADNTSTFDAANDHGLAAQIGLVALFDGRIEGVHVDMNYGWVIHGGEVPMSRVDDLILRRLVLILRTRWNPNRRRQPARIAREKKVGEGRFGRHESGARLPQPCGSRVSPETRPCLLSERRLLSGRASGPEMR